MVNLQDGYIQVTRDCNQECIFCSQPKGDEYLTLAEIKHQMDIYKGQGITSIVFTGGEPTIHPDILEAIKYAAIQGFQSRMITNGAKLADREFCKKIIAAGLGLVIVSIHTHKPEVAKKLSLTENLPKTLEGIGNMIALGQPIYVNTTVMNDNWRDLHEFAAFMTERFPSISHYVFNFVDGGGRADQNPVMPKLSDIELELKLTLDIMIKKGKSFRVERVPLCYMCDYEEYSSETRRLIGNQEYRTFFVKERETMRSGKGMTYSKDYVKSEPCKACMLTSVCAGLKDNYVKVHGTGELYPIFKSAKRFIDLGLSD